MSWLNRLIVTMLPGVPRSLVRRVAGRYFAGETRESALDTVRSLNQKGAMATLDVLGEEVKDPSKAQAAVDEYVHLFDAIADQGLNANVSVKLTMLGLKIDEDLCWENLVQICDAAQRHANFLRLDMEDRTCTDATLRLYRRLFDRYANVGTVLQAYMRRTLGDIERLPEQGANIRICKGIYIEPREAAWKGYDTVRQAFLAALEKMLRNGVYAGIATHDEFLVAGASALLDRYQTSEDLYEFQMLLGVDEQLRSILLKQHRLRVYVPYGVDWYAYSLRRMRENPEIAGHVTKAVLGLG